MVGITRPALKRFLDDIALPIRALFMGPEGRLGLTSMRDERMWQVAQFCQGRVLDVGCGPGNLFIKKFIGTELGVGVDFFAYEGVERLIEDPTHLPFGDSSFDTVTLVAVGGHIPKHLRSLEFIEFARVLKPGGRLVMTEGEPITQTLSHKWQHFYLGLQGKVDMDHERGMEEDEEFCMPREELLGYLNSGSLRHILTRRFQWGLNNLYVAEKTA
jgi:SAM-dependent methyltransferase